MALPAVLPDNSGGSGSRPSAKCTVILVLVAWALRFAVMLTSPATLVDDADGYLAHARMLADGRGFVGPHTGQPTAFRPPLYPLALAAVIRLGAGDAAAVAIVNQTAVLVLLWTVLTYGRSMGASGRWTVLVQLAIACDPLLIRYSVAPMTEVICAAVLLAAVTRVRCGLAAGSSGSRLRNLLAAGCLFGCGALVRPVVLVSCVLLTAWLVGGWISNRRTRDSVTADSAAGRLRTGAVPLPAILVVPLAAVLTLLPWIIRNEQVFGKFVPATTHGGYTLALGNNPDFYRDVINGSDGFPWDGAALDAWQQRMIADLQRDGVPRGDEVAEDAWYYRQAMSAIRNDPRSFLKAVQLRQSRFWAVTTADGSVSPVVRLLTGGWYVVVWAGLLLSLLGCEICGKSRESGPESSRGSADLWLVVLSFVLMHTVYWTDARMRAPVMPELLMLSVGGWCRLRRHPGNSTRA